LHEEWVSVTSRAHGDVGDMIGAGFMYEYFNASIPTSVDSDMWQINYVETSDFIETSNVTWHSYASSGWFQLSVVSYAM